MQSQKFTDLATNILRHAMDLGTQAGVSTPDSEYLLLALLDNEETKQKFLAVGINHDNVASVIANSFPVQKEKSAAPKKQFSKDFTEVLERASWLSVQMNVSKPITTDFLILGIIRQDTSNARRVLEMLAVDLNKLEAILLANIKSADGGERHVADAPSLVGAGNRAQRPAQGANKNSVLAQFATNLSQKARDGELDPVIGREKEIERTLQVLSRRTKNNPVLVGEPGVGKTAIVEGLAQALLSDSNIPDSVKERDVWSLDLGGILAGTRYRGDFEERLKKLVKEIQTTKAIVFIDEIHALIGAGGGEGSLNAANILKPVLARGEMQTVGATTYDEYRKYFEKDAAMARRFQQIDVNEPSVPEAIQILKGLRAEYEAHHDITFTDKAIEAAVTLSARYVNDRFLPDKAIDLIDEAGAKAKINRFSTPESVKGLEKELSKLILEKQAAIEAEDFLAAADFRSQEDTLKASIREETEKYRNSEVSVIVDDADIAAVLTASTGIPVTLLSEDGARLMNMESEIATRVIGQKAAITTIARSVRRQRAGLKDPNRPAGSFIFAGPTGVGKTELAKALAEFMFQDENALISLDMSEYGEKHTVSRLFGAPPGYVGHEEGGQLTERVRRKPYSVILLDEIEKAHPDIFNPLLQVLEEGRLTDGQGRVIDFKNTIIIMTTNLGARQLASSPVGFQLGGDANASYEMMKSKVLTELKQEFKPEFLNRLDDIVVFPYLSEEELMEIIDVFIGRLNKRLVENNLTVTVTEAAKRHLISVGYDATLGARPLRRAMQQNVEDGISEILLFGGAPENRIIDVDFVAGKLTFNGKNRDELATVPEVVTEA